MRQKLTLRVRLALLVAGTALPLIVFSAAITYLNYERNRELASSRILEVARGMGLAVDRELQRLTAVLQVLALSRSLQHDDLIGFRHEATAFIEQHPRGANLAVSNREGAQLLNMAVPPGVPLPRRADPRTVEEVFRTGQSVISDLFIGTVLKRPVFSIDVPILRDGKVIYDLAFTPPLSLFDAILHEQRAQEGWVLSVFDRNGVNVARIPNSERFVGTRAAESLYRVMSKNQEGIADTTSLEGMPLLTAFSRAPASGWSVAIGMPREVLTRPLWRSLATTLAIGAMLLLIGLAFAVRMARRIARAESQRDLLINELNHRVKNTLAIVQSIVSRTLANSPIGVDVRDAVESRLVALSNAHTMLSEEKWISAELRDLIERTLEPFGVKDKSRFQISGPIVHISPRFALTLAMVLHELATNAMKYGALSQTSGHVTIDWAFDEAETTVVSLRWRELGGPPVHAPQHKGFGSMLLERSIAHELKGKAALDFQRSGLVCLIEFPLAAVEFNNAAAS